MKRQDRCKWLWMIMISLLVFGCADGGQEMLGSVINTLAGGETLNMETIAQGLKEALTKGTGQAVGTLSQAGGYSKNPLLRIVVPEKLSKMTDTLRKIGMGKQVDLFEARMNEAAEQAAAQAKPVFLTAIKEMTFDDARNILKGNETAATDYFREKTGTQLTAMYGPIVKERMETIGAAKSYNNLVAAYNALPFSSKPDFSLENYVTTAALKGLFSELAAMEKDIRQNPAARTTALLKKVFAQAGR